MSAVWTPERLGQPVPSWQRALERRLRREVQESVRRQQAGLPPDSPPLGPEAVQAAIDTVVVAARREAVRSAQLWPSDSPALAARLARDLLGDGPLTELLARPGVTDVWINRPDLILYAWPTARSTRPRRASTTTTRCRGWSTAGSGRWTGAWTWPSPTSTRGCPGAPACTRSCRR